MNNLFFAKLLFISFQILFSVSHAAQNNEIQGTIYIVTNSKNSIRMPLVDVFLYSKHQYLTARSKANDAKRLYLEEKSAELSELIDKKNLIEPEVTMALDEISEIRSRAESGSKECIINGGNYSTCIKYVDHMEMLKATRLFDQYKPMIDELSQTRGKISEINKKADSLGSIVFTIELISQEHPIAESKTNINGYFSLKTNRRGEFIVVAKSQRQTLSEKEQYTWAVFAKNGEKIELTNDNLIETMCKKCAR